MIYQTLLDHCPDAVPTEGMAREEWLKRRTSCIGGSDAGAVMNLNGYGSPLTVYLEKKGMVENKAGRAAKRGNMLEPLIREQTRSDFPALTIETVPYMFRSPVHPFMGANIDGAVLAEHPLAVRGRIIEGLGGYEAKSSKTGWGFSGDEIPDSHYAQVQHYMSVLNLPWFLLSVYIIDRDDVWHYPILRNEDFINNLVEKERDFWEGFFIPGVMPAAAGIDSEDSMITGLFNGGASPLRLGEEEALMCEDYVEINRRTEELEKRKKAVAVKLKEAIIRRLPPSSDPSACGKVSAAAGHYRVSWSRVETSRVDTEALKKAGIYEKYVKKSESGRFSITEKKEG